MSADNTTPERVSAVLRYHVPRSQVWLGSRGGQEGKLHIHVTEPLRSGRLSRAVGQALCGRRGWYERPSKGETAICSNCAEKAARYGVAVPPIEGRDTDA